uniref:Uncharacterized protein n=1 Tax=Scophthalmus maximus TaxID=52904 RepID=A0A8D3CNS8_SCOMX
IVNIVSVHVIYLEEFSYLVVCGSYLICKLRACVCAHPCMHAYVCPMFRIDKSNDYLKLALPANTDDSFDKFLNPPRGSSNNVVPGLFCFVFVNFNLKAAEA